MINHQFTFQPATFLRINAIGVPGERTFFLQGGDENSLITLLVEKVQIQVMAVGAIRMIDEIEDQQKELGKTHADYVEADMKLVLPVDPLFRVDEVALGYDQESDLFVLQVSEEGAEEDRQKAMFWVTRGKMRGLALWALDLANRGRPDPLEPKTPGGNGFRHGNNGHKS